MGGRRGAGGGGGAVIQKLSESVPDNVSVSLRRIHQQWQAQQQTAKDIKRGVKERDRMVKAIARARALANRIAVAKIRREFRNILRNTLSLVRTGKMTTATFNGIMIGLLVRS